MHDGCRKHGANARSVILELQMSRKLTDQRRHHPGSESLARRTSSLPFVGNNQPESGLVLGKRYVDRSRFACIRVFVDVDDKLGHDQPKRYHHIDRQHDRREVQSEMLLPFISHRPDKVPAEVFNIAPGIGYTDFVSTIKTAMKQ